MAVRARFTRITKVHDLVMAGVPTEVIPTYCALADHASNRTALCWPKMATLARRLSRTPRTIQRHLHLLLKEKGLVEFVERRRDGQGRLGSYLYRVVHIAAVAARGATARRVERGSRTMRVTKRPATTGHGSRVASSKGQHERKEGTPQTPQEDPKAGYWWCFGEDAPPGAEDAHRRDANKQREEQARRRIEGYDWLFR